MGQASFAKFTTKINPSKVLITTSLPFDCWGVEAIDWALWWRREKGVAHRPRGKVRNPIEIGGRLAAKRLMQIRQSDGVSNESACAPAYVVASSFNVSVVS